MSVETQRDVINRIVDEAYNHGNFAVLNEAIAPDFTSELLPEDMPGGPDIFKRMITGFRVAFPDLHFTVDDQIAEPGKVVNRWTMTGTHSGPFLGLAPSGRPVTLHGISIWYLRDHAVTDFWVVMDELSLRQQLGATE